MKARVIIPFANLTGSYTTGEIVDLSEKEAGQLSAAGIVEIVPEKKAVETATLPEPEQAVARKAPRRKSKA